jgi:hypothetical protein
VIIGGVHSRRTSVCSVVATVSLSVGSLRLHSQTPASTETSQTVLTKLFPLTYAPLDRQTRIFGDVDILVEINKDDAVKSAVAVRGHPLLVKAAIDSAQKSEFQCAGCAAEGYSVRLTFHLEDADACPPTEKNLGDPRPTPVVSRVAQSLALQH